MDNNISNNLIYKNEFALLIDPSSDGNFITQNDFGQIGETQDNGITNNFVSNYWSDWDGSGRYMIDGSANNQDSTPKNNPIHMSGLNLDILVSTTNGITSDLMTIS